MRKMIRKNEPHHFSVDHAELQKQTSQAGKVRAKGPLKNSQQKAELNGASSLTIDWIHVYLLHADKS